MQFLRSVRGENLSYTQLFDLLSAAIPFNEAVIISLLPNGRLQVVQPQRVSETLARVYCKDAWTRDRLTWDAIRQRGVARTGLGGVGESIFADAGLVEGISVAIESPIFAGYPAALHLYRTADRTKFSDADASMLTTVAEAMTEALQRCRTARGGRLTDPSARNFYMFDASGSRLAIPGTPVLNGELAMAMVREVGRQMSIEATAASIGNRVSIAGEQGELKSLQVVRYNSYSPLGEGGFVGFFVPPSHSDWATLRASDLAANPELSRMLPATRFMQTEYHNGPSLTDIARTVHLSPFHFHRRFTETVGSTPKQFLLDCQISEARRQLTAGELGLADISRACGFAHQSHFTSRFKQATGMTPTRWRRHAGTHDRNAPPMTAVA